MRQTDINRATVDDLLRVPTLTRDHAHLILDYRDRLGGFKDLTDIKAVPGVANGLVTQLRAHGFFVPSERQKAA